MILLTTPPHPISRVCVTSGSSVGMTLSPQSHHITSQGRFWTDVGFQEPLTISLTILRTYQGAKEWEAKSKIQCLN